MILFAALALATASVQDAGDPPRFTFAVVGHLRGDKNGELVENLDEVIDELERARPDLVFLCGDLIWGDIHSSKTEPATIRADWDALDAKLARLSVPVHRVPGNHDVNEVTTRDVWLERYGALPKSITFRGSKFLLMNSAWWPPDGSAEKHRYIRGKDLDAGQIEFLGRELADRKSRAHVFVFMHHMLWWEEAASWWTRVHPGLAAAEVDAVFAGDYGPMKFSALARDGVRYVQTSIENGFSLPMLRALESSRILSSQFDNFVLVHVDGKNVRYDVRTVGALSTGKFAPAHFRAINEYDKDTFGRKLFRRCATPDDLIRNLALAAAASFAAGVVATALFVFLRRRRARKRRGAAGGDLG